MTCSTLNYRTCHSSANGSCEWSPKLSTAGSASHLFVCWSLLFSIFSCWGFYRISLSYNTGFNQSIVDNLSLRECRLRAYRQMLGLVKYFEHSSSGSGSSGSSGGSGGGSSGSSSGSSRCTVGAEHRWLKSTCNYDVLDVCCSEKSMPCECWAGLQLTAWTTSKALFHLCMQSFPAQWLINAHMGMLALGLNK